jgi:hypothetical protein
MKKFYKVKGSNKQYETPFDLMADEDIVTDNGLNEFENEEGYISFHDFVNQANEILQKDYESTKYIYSQQASRGDYSKQASSGDCSKQASSGYGTKQASSGNGSQQASSGYGSQQASSGDYSKQASSGDYSKQASSGDCSKQASSGYGSKQASSGDYSKQASSGDYSKQASSGIGTKHIINGKRSIASSVGYKSILKGINGTWFSLADYQKENNELIPCLIKAGQIGVSLDWKGNVLKENQYYMLIDGEFTPILIVDGDYMIPLSEKKMGEYKIYHCYYEVDYRRGEEEVQKVYVAEKDGIFAHGETVKQAISDVIFKSAQGRGAEQYRDLNLDSEVTYDEAVTMYRIITGACQYGTQRFIDNLPKDKIKDKYSIREIINLTAGEFGSGEFRRFFEEA